MSDLLYHIPSRFDDFSLISKISYVQPGEVVTIQGNVLEVKSGYTKRFKQVQKVTISDETGTIEVTWFNQPYLLRTIKVNDLLSLSGKVEFFGKTKTLVSPAFETMVEDGTTIHTGRLVPVYPETQGVSSKWLRRQVYSLLASLPIIEYLPPSVLQEYNLMPLPQALKTVHFPHTLEEAQRARERLAFDELLLLQLRGMKRKNEWEKQTKGNVFHITPYQKEIEKFWKNLPFTLTDSQKKAVHAIFADLGREKPMNRLLQGDVGSGKTVVATAALYVSFLNGFQSVLMAPTEILAEQHFKTVSNLLEPLGVRVELVTGGNKSGSKKQELRIKGKKNTHDSNLMIHDSDFNILVGTHAVLYDKVKFDKLGLVVIDEQQRFGVAQRGLIRSKGDNPHVLTMTATPIPRTVALTMYGDLDLSYLDEMPKGRRIIKTWLVPAEKRENAYGWIRKQIIETDSQAFIICPFIEQSETMQTVKAAAGEYERLKKDIFPDLKLGLLHGRLKAKEKEEELGKFRNKNYHALVATPVVEVGIDIPNATVIVIEASERFGLAQLHQLRGRVGRGEKQSYCLLFTETKSPVTIQKLKSLETTHVGARLAEIDLRLRGPGELYGTLQSGVPNLKIASFSDVTLIERAKKVATQLLPVLSAHPELSKLISEAITGSVTPN